MTISELEQQLLSLNQAEREHLAELLNQSLATPSTTPSPEAWNDLHNLPTTSAAAAWNRALQQL
jgi:hypothetical protein